MFLDPRHRLIIRSMRRVITRESVIDPVIVAEDLRSAGDLEAAGDLGYLEKLTDAVPTALNLPYHAEIVMERAERRREIAAARQIIVDADDGSLDLDEVRARRVQRFVELDRSAYIGRTSRLICDEELVARPRPLELISGVMPVGGLVVVYGPPGAGKSFMVLDWALSVATGFRWLGREVRQGPVVYIAAEGSAGLGPRIRSWKAHRGYVGTAGVRFLAESVNLMEPAEVERLLAECRGLEESPALVIVDTLARCMIVGDENSTSDMSSFIAGADRIRRETGATVCIIHHTRRDSTLERGSSALRGAADTMVAIRGDRKEIVVTCTKQKDTSPFENLRLRLVPVADSCVIEGADGSVHQVSDDLTRSQRQALEELHRLAPSRGLTKAEWERSSELKRRTFYDVTSVLVERGYVVTDRPGRGAVYTLSDKGLAALGAKVQNGATEL
jgi:hypothetical protein